MYVICSIAQLIVAAGSSADKIVHSRHNTQSIQIKTHPPAAPMYAQLCRTDSSQKHRQYIQVAATGLL